RLQEGLLGGDLVLIGRPVDREAASLRPKLSLLDEIPRDDHVIRTTRFPPEEMPPGQSEDRARSHPEEKRLGRASGIGERDGVFRSTVLAPIEREPLLVQSNGEALESLSEKRRSRRRTEKDNLPTSRHWSRFGGDIGFDSGAAPPALHALDLRKLKP